MDNDLSGVVSFFFSLRPLVLTIITSSCGYGGTDAYSDYGSWMYLW